jgi:hypothetical protein
MRLARRKVNVIFFDGFDFLCGWSAAGGKCPIVSTERWKVSDSFHRTVETIKTWWKLTNFGGNYF